MICLDYCRSFYFFVLFSIAEKRKKKIGEKKQFADVRKKEDPQQFAHLLSLLVGSAFG